MGKGGTSIPTFDPRILPWEFPPLVPARLPQESARAYLLVTSLASFGSLYLLSPQCEERRREKSMLRWDWDYESSDHINRSCPHLLFNIDYRITFSSRP